MKSLSHFVNVKQSVEIKRQDHSLQERLAYRCHGGFCLTVHQLVYDLPILLNYLFSNDAVCPIYTRVHPSSCVK